MHVMARSMISLANDLMILLDAAFKDKGGLASFGYVMILNGVIVDAGAITCSKDAEARPVLVALEKVKVKKKKEE